MHMIAIKKSMAELKNLASDPSISSEVQEMAAEDMEKLKYMSEYYEWLDRLVDAFENEDIFTLVPKKTEE